MAKRAKPQQLIAPIGSLEDADKALAEIAEIDRIIEAANSRMNEDIDSLKKETQEIIAPHVERKDALGAGLYNFAELHKIDLFAKKKSRELDFGTIGYRKTSALELMKKISTSWKVVLERIKENKLLEAIRIKEEVDKETMSKWPSERLELVGVKREEKDEFYYETKQEAVEAQP